MGIFHGFLVAFVHYRFHKISKTIPDYIWKKMKEDNKATKISKPEYDLQSIKKAKLSAL